MKKSLVVFLLMLTPVASFYSKEPARLSKKEIAQRTKSAYDFYQDILASHQKKEWKQVILSCKALLATYTDSPFNSEASYYKGVAYFHLGDFDLANNAFAHYLKNETTPKFFEEAIGYKFEIAEKFYEGAKRHLLGMEKLPKIIPGKEDALEIYEEIITALPRHDLTAKSLYKKGVLLYDFNEFKESVEAFEVLIRRFPKHYYAPEGFLGVQKVYLKQSQQEFPDPDILELAQLNLHRFKESFPSEPKLARAYEMLEQTYDCFAKDLFEVGHFYERTKKPEAAIIYYTSVISQYPQSSYAKKAATHIEQLNKKNQIAKNKK